ncbi:class I SAM-dependent methyltransferase [Mycobacterium ostraviense]|uniref:Methyltransferase domain-containing protein n=1 Tax=Mycobacterium ostraviense TaxID=2738409 RepID=A0A164A3L8_9MYCO|nr:class I SAM-dependent methyltransferase [Mycobacterium ostraviense]KZS62069.1 hypothetical protein A4G28_18740 [Mycobacterium ostraviense]UGT90534.1 class I SAM-dependent methyltransferase [Mycobacterium ostraviense]
MTDNQIHTQYSTGLTQPSIRQALLAAGKDLEHLRPEDLTLLEDFHTMGRFATTELVDLIGITADMRVLDAGSGIGGAARFVADRCRCRVTAVDLTDEYCETNRWLNRLVGLDERISVRQPDVTELPFPAATFDIVFSQGHHDDAAAAVTTRQPAWAARLRHRLLVPHLRRRTGDVRITSDPRLRDARST